MLVHGYTGSRRDFAHVVPELEKLARTITYDQRGHGAARSAAEEGPLDFAVLTRDLAELFDGHGLSRAHLLGHSMGGKVALRFVLAHPERVASLVLMGTSAEAVPLGPVFRPSLKERLLRPLRERLGRDPAAKMADALYATEEARARFREVVRASHRDVHPRAVSALHEAIVHAESLLPRLGEIRCPTTVLVGAHDHPFVEASTDLADRIPGARLIRFEHASHYPHFEQEDAWLDAVRAHLQGAIVAAKIS